MTAKSFPGNLTPKKKGIKKKNITNKNERETKIAEYCIIILFFVFAISVSQLKFDSIGWLDELVTSLRGVISKRDFF